MARLKKGETPTPANERLAKYRDELTKRGGRRIIVDLEADAADALDAVVAAAEPSRAPVKDAVTSALIAFARSKKRKA